MTQRRWTCPHCHAEGWSADGAMPPHDRSAGGSCRPSGQVSDREAARLFSQSMGIAFEPVADWVVRCKEGRS